MNLRLFFIIYSSVVISLFACVPLQQGSTDSYQTVKKKLFFNNHIYEDNIKTVRLYLKDSPYPRLHNDAVPLNNSNNLILEFDALNEDFNDYRAEIIHCNRDWKKSSLMDQEFLNEYNEFIINDFNYSVNTLTLYTNYKLQLPRVKSSGNYLIKVYKNNNSDNLIITQRYVVYDNSIRIDAQVGLVPGGRSMKKYQKVDFAINYGDLEVFNPLDDIFICLRQNNRWDNAIKGLKPTLIREDQSYLEYRHIDLQNAFISTNEFRFFDLRTLTYKGLYVNKISKASESIEALIIDKERNNLAYTQVREDLNGNFFIENRDPTRGPLQEEYVTVNFLLEEEKIEEDVYLIGNFNNWSFSEENKIRFDSLNNNYSYAWLLKQGLYNYVYATKNEKNPYPFDGSFFEAENEYEVIVYFRDPIRRNDLVAGYKSISSRN